MNDTIRYKKINMPTKRRWSSRVAVPLFIYSSSAMANHNDPLQVQIGLSTQQQAVQAAASPENALASIIVNVSTGLANDPSRDQDEQQLLTVLTNVSNTSGSENAKALRELSARAATAQTSFAIHGIGLSSLEPISQRLAVLRRNPLYTSADNSTASTDDESALRWMSAALGDVVLEDQPEGWFAKRSGGAVSGGFSSSAQSETDTFAGFDNNTTGITFGGDYKINRNLLAGAAVHLANSDLSLESNGGSLKGDTANFVFYGTYFFQNPQWFAEGIMNVGATDFEMDRNIQFSANGTATQATANSSTSASSFGLNAGGGYNYVISENFGITYSSHFLYSSTAIDGYEENSGGALNLAVASQDVTTTSLDFTAAVSRLFRANWGFVIPRGSLSVVQRLAGKGQDIEAYFVADQNKTPFSFTTEKPDANYFTLTLDASMVSKNGISGFVGYQTFLMSKNYSQSTWAVGVRAEF